MWKRVFLLLNFTYFNYCSKQLSANHPLFQLNVYSMVRENSDAEKISTCKNFCSSMNQNGIRHQIVCGSCDRADMRHGHEEYTLVVKLCGFFFYYAHII